MLRRLLTVVCVIEVLAPERLIERAEALALANPDDCEVRPWVVPGARVEGAVFLLALWRSDRSYARFKRFLGVVGLLALLYPERYLEVGSELAYVDGSAPRWKPWVAPATRLVGLLYVLVALGELRRAGREPDAAQK
ncbi:hypothetical protein [Halorarius halobius]|uniref:hypothetical protein n=1 Tax=Halorarius halobius TaxID=2962671 RepID=UPI0020CB9F54|nr:hypothetical protein [Halorarius halobius]